jgi:hypothetical protein
VATGRPKFIYCVWGFARDIIYMECRQARRHSHTSFLLGWLARRTWPLNKTPLTRGPGRQVSTVMPSTIRRLRRRRASECEDRIDTVDHRWVAASRVGRLDGSETVAAEMASGGPVVKVAGNEDWKCMCFCMCFCFCCMWHVACGMAQLVTCMS